ncbi:hypothetical protein [Quadrisphaera sp. DSM 44207]|uniref:hypothetical protein n=1 Tax=Quadrisphaera sp. DSM 44207 TaxID=1881057 RepID=UPI000888ED30|nr:hypothetical protein [Quadrisphaera sp. DSM 44207]SDQ34273.1 hypothetical protein SAMN05428996_1318 [Quadrisphaera sp. DSM 44207]
MKVLRTALAGTGALALTVLGSSSAFAAETYQVQLQELNGTGSSGTAVLTLDGDRLTVTIDAKGLVPGAPHAQHIHGSTDLSTDFSCPTMAADANQDGVLTTAEGLKDYGDIHISLTTSGDTSKSSGLAVDRFPTADAQGNLAYERTIEVDDATAKAITNLHVVQHGIDVNGNGTYDVEAAGASELDPALPQEATAPASCGMVTGSHVTAMPAGGVQTGGGDTGAVDTGALLGGAGALAAAAAGALVLARRRTGAEG